jgi:hypothetical protein
VLMNAPFHTIRDANDAYSLTILNGDVVESLSLLAGGAPARYGDRTGAVLDVQTREGNREEFSGRASLGTTGVYGTAEAPLGALTLLHGRSKWREGDQSDPSQAGVTGWPHRFHRGGPPGLPRRDRPDARAPPCLRPGGSHPAHPAHRRLRRLRAVPEPGRPARPIREP